MLNRYMLSLIIAAALVTFWTLTSVGLCGYATISRFGLPAVAWSAYSER